MKLKVRSIGNSRGIILPQSVLEQLGDAELELTLIGNTAVLSRSDTQDNTQDGREARAALAYASVKAKRHTLFKRLSKDQAES